MKVLHFFTFLVGPSFKRANTRTVARSAEEVRALMHEAGFRAVEPLRTRRPMLTRLVVGRA